MSKIQTGAEAEAPAYHQGVPSRLRQGFVGQAGTVCLAEGHSIAFSENPKILLI